MADDQDAAIGNAIRVRGARVHNLCNLDLDVPRDRLVVLTGVSGSGKSTLAFDTLFAEGQRRYIEGLSTYARQFLDQLERPDVDRIDGLPPTVAIDQQRGAASPRSTVATLTEAADYLRLLYARAGLPHCPRCGREIRRQSPERMVSSVLALGAGRKVIVLAPLVRGRKGLHAEAFAAIRRAGLIRARVDGETIEIGAEIPRLAPTKSHDIEAVVDRLVVRDGIRPRLAESVDLALKLGQGTIVLSIQHDDGWRDRTLSVKFACPECDVGLEALEPRTFSFNSPQGACPECQGLGTVTAFDPALIVPDPSRSLDQGAVAIPLGQEGVALWNEEQLRSFLRRHKLTRKKALAAWPEAARRAWWSGEPDGWPGVLPTLERLYQEDPSVKARVRWEELRSAQTCSACGGARLRAEARAVTVGGRGIHEVVGLDVVAALAFLDGLSFEPPLDQVGPPLVREIARRLAFLDRVGLGYLSLERPADTLSGGELQRVRLATQIGSGLVGVCYVLDEPTSGLHPRDTDRLLASLVDLRDQGNSVLVVEHDEATIRAADWLIDLGPGAGPFGGRLVAQGPPSALVECGAGASATARYLQRGAAGEPQGLPHRDRLARSRGAITVRQASAHNLKGIDARFPLGVLTCVTGVSGSGKSTLVLEILARAAHRALGGQGPAPGTHQGIDGLDQIDALVTIDQSPIGRTPRSTPATATGVFDAIRKVFATAREAKVRGFTASRFSFNVKGGRCETCQGQGSRKVEMNFLPGLVVRCEACQGRRFNRATLGVKYRGQSIADVLEMRVNEAREFFANVPTVRPGLDALHDAGLGYLTLGQPAGTLSGGEAQRVKLAAELGRTGTGTTLHILDEPTTGLHFDDVATLMTILHKLADRGHTLIVIEHNLDVIRQADWILDLGPEGGGQGGQIIAEGTPAEVAANPSSVTGRYLRVP